MHSCTETARRIGSRIAPCWGSKVMRKNRLGFDIESIELILRSQWVYLDLVFDTENGTVPHECIIKRTPGVYLVQDSYLNYRDETIRYYTESDMQSYLISLCDMDMDKAVTPWDVDPVARRLFDIPPQIPKIKKVGGYVSVLRT
jgi:hypothetical protein